MGRLMTDNATFLVANGQTTSSGIEMGDWGIMGLIVPTITSGTLKIQVSQDNSNFFDLYDSSGTQALSWSASTGARAFASNDLEAMRGYKYFRVVLGASQGADRTFTYTFKLEAQ